MQRTRPEGACSGHTLPVARIGACVKRRFREISSCQEFDSPVRRYGRPAAFGGFLLFGVVLSRGLAKSDGARRIPCAPRAYGMPSQPCTRSRNAVAQPVLSIAAGAGGAEPGANRTRRDHPDHDGRLAGGAVSGGDGSRSRPPPRTVASSVHGRRPAPTRAARRLGDAGLARLLLRIYRAVPPRAARR